MVLLSLLCRWQLDEMTTVEMVVAVIIIEPTRLIAKGSWGSDDYKVERWVYSSGCTVLWLFMVICLSFSFKRPKFDANAMAMDGYEIEAMTKWFSFPVTFISSADPVFLRVLSPSGSAPIITPSSSSSLKSTDFQRTKKTKILVHDYLENSAAKWIRRAAMAIVKEVDQESAITYLTWFLWTTHNSSTFRIV